MEKWDRRNQAVLEEHNKRPAPTAADLAAMVLVFVIGNIVFRVGVAAIDGWQGWVLSGVSAFAAALLASVAFARWRRSR